MCTDKNVRNLLPSSAVNQKSRCSETLVVFESQLVDLQQAATSGDSIYSAIRTFVIEAVLMHEMSLCEDIVKLLEEEAQNQGFKKVRQVYLEIGELAGVEIEAMRFSFDIVTHDTIADGASLGIESIPGSAHCEQCGQTVPVAQRFAACPICDNYPLTLISGNELKIKELEVT